MYELFFERPDMEAYCGLVRLSPIMVNRLILSLRRAGTKQAGGTRWDVEYFGIATVSRPIQFVAMMEEQEEEGLWSDYELVELRAA